MSKAPAGLTPLALQRAAGNRATTALLAARTVAQREGDTDRPMVRQGSHGEDVRHAQQRLDDHGAAPPLDVDGAFGPLTRRATIAYQRSHALATDGVIGPRTWSSLAGPTSVGGSSGQRRGRPSGPPAPGGVLRYDSDNYTLSSPGQTALPRITAAITAKQQATPPELGQTVRVDGVTAGTDAERYVWNILRQLGQRSRWGTEVDLVAEIGPPPRPNAPAPVGRVTLRIDAAGNATASLVAAGPVPAVPAFADRPTAEARLRADFGFSSVSEVAPAQWTLDELAKVHAALSRLAAAERTALAGVELVREQTLTLNGQSVSGLFDHSASLASGATTATRSESLKFADSAFSGDNVSFVGDGTTSAPGSFLTILHEAGHAVETKAVRDTRFAELEAQAELNAAINATAAEIATFNSNQTTARAAVNAYTRQQGGQSARLVNAHNAVRNALQAMTSNRTVARIAALDAAAVAAIARRDAATTALGTAAPSHPALTDLAPLAASEDKWLTAAQDQAAAVRRHDAARTTARAAAPGPGGQSRRLRDFVAVVIRNRIPRLTSYAEQNWPARPQEFFAEAFSLWRNDRAYLQTNAPALVAWFDAGNHLV